MLYDADQQQTAAHDSPGGAVRQLAAFQEATDWINANPADAAQLYLTNSGDKDTPANVQAGRTAEIAPG